jgi:4-amino-4-deoxy-L-arabinose transferase-like glycosyltransferase
MTPIRTGWILLGIVALYLALGAAYAVRTPAWQNPDEPAHYNYIAQVAADGCCPVIEPGDWDQTYLDALRANAFAPALLDRITTVEYEDHQPPLYYLLAALLYRLTPDLIALRLLSVLFGAVAVLAAFAVGRLLAPERPAVALVTAALVAFIPQRLAMMASVNNDGLAEGIVGLALWALLLALRSGSARAHLLLGAIIGVGLLTKVTIYWLAGVVPLALVAGWWLAQPRPSLGVLVRRAALCLLPILLMGGLWWARNLSVYGGTDFLGLGAHDAVVVGQPRSADLIAEIGMTAFLQRGVATTFRSFWGQLGWMALPLPAWAYVLIMAGLALAPVGWLLRPRASGARPAWRAAAWLALWLAVALTLAQMILYNMTFIQFQGRYLYPALIPVALALAFGWEGVARRLAGRWALLALVIPALLLPLNAFVLWRVLPLLES